MGAVRERRVVGLLLGVVAACAVVTASPVAAAPDPLPRPGLDGPVGTHGQVGNNGPVGTHGQVGNNGPVGTHGRVGNNGPVGTHGQVGNNGPVGTHGH
ncbi:MAG TPA: hypothetical protein VGJ14_09495, partial [Sporichthyaceae bacterium]